MAKTKTAGTKLDKPPKPNQAGGTIPPDGPGGPKTDKSIPRPDQKKTKTS